MVRALLLACLLAVPLEIFEISKESKPQSFVVLDYAKSCNYKNAPNPFKEWYGIACERSRSFWIRGD